MVTIRKNAAHLALERLGPRGVVAVDQAPAAVAGRKYVDDLQLVAARTRASDALIDGMTLVVGNGDLDDSGAIVAPYAAGLALQNTVIAHVTNGNYELAAAALADFITQLGADAADEEANGTVYFDALGRPVSRRKGISRTAIRLAAMAI